jgi:hypothetical protein
MPFEGSLQGKNYYTPQDSTQSQGLSYAGMYSSKPTQDSGFAERMAGYTTQISQIGVGTAPLSFGQSLVLSAIVQIGGGILSAMFAPKPRRSAQEAYFQKLVTDYGKLGKRTAAARAIASALAGKQLNIPMQSTDDFLDSQTGAV